MRPAGAGRWSDTTDPVRADAQNSSFVTGSWVAITHTSGHVTWLLTRPPRSVEEPAVSVFHVQSRALGLKPSVPGLGIFDFGSPSVR